MTDYKLGEHLGLDKNGELEIQSSKEKLVKMAEREIQEWLDFIQKLNSDK